MDLTHAVAHSPGLDGVWHLLDDHLQGTARRAAGFANAFGASEWGRLAGLWHDLGKFAPRWQAYLRASATPGAVAGPSPGHSLAGACRAAEANLMPVLFAIAGHHGGIPESSALKARVQQGRSKPDVLEAFENALTVPPAVAGSSIEWPALIKKDPLLTDIFTRLLYSALLDADFLDTEAHARPEQGEARQTPDETTVSMAELLQRLRRTREPIQTPPTPVHALRETWREAALAHAGDPQGFFRLSLPTGGGKTLSSLEFALDHAVRHGLHRVVIAVPFITITEQTSGVLRRVLGDPGDGGIVLEHHSGSADDLAPPDDPDDIGTGRWARLSAENWDAPVIVTTTVQLFESLFGNRPARCRKVHRLARSVIIIDEAQSLPVSLVTPLIDGLRGLIAVGSATVILSTATQPAFETIPALAGLGACDLVPMATPIPDAFRRVRYDFQTQTRSPWSSVAGWMRDHQQALAIVNTKAHAMALLDALDDPDVLHLSTLLCGAHRRAVLSEVRDRLRTGRPCQLVATQVVEAGVDIDFPFVVRAEGPWDAIVQAAGRCNREGRLPFGQLRVFRPQDDAIPSGAYRTGTDLTQKLVAEGHDPDDPEASREYFTQLFAHADPDARKVQFHRTKFDFPEVAARVRLIDSDSVPVIITTHGDTAERERVHSLLDLLHSEPWVARRTLRRLQPYVVSLYRRQADEARGKGWVTSERPGGPETWAGRYDRIRGVIMDDLSQEGFMW